MIKSLFSIEDMRQKYRVYALSSVSVREEKEMDKNFEDLLKELKEIKDGQIEILRKEKEYRNKLYGKKFLVSEFLSVLNDMLPYKDKILSLLNVLTSGSDVRLNDWKLDVDIDKEWGFIARFDDRADKRDRFSFGVYDKSGNYLFKCCYYLREGCENRDEVTVREEWFARIEDGKAVDVNAGAVTFSTDSFKKVGDFVSDFKSIDFGAFLNKVVEDLIEEQKKILEED